eukprot:7720627-Ditylum_brightwellii.AAC.1
MLEEYNTEQDKEDKELHDGPGIITNDDPELSPPPLLHNREEDQQVTDNTEPTDDTEPKICHNDNATQQDHSIKGVQEDKEMPSSAQEGETLPNTENNSKDANDCDDISDTEDKNNGASTNETITGVQDEVEMEAHHVRQEDETKPDPEPPTDQEQTGMQEETLIAQIAWAFKEADATLQ